MRSVLTDSRTSAQRRADLKKQAKAKGLSPMTPEQFEMFLAKFHRLWPTDQDIDEFVTWVRETRKKEGQPRGRSRR